MSQKNRKILLSEYEKIESKIKKRTSEFKKIGTKKDKERIFEEMVFCLLTPQSKAKNAWEAVLNMRSDGSLYNGSEESMKKHLRKIRFLNNKAKYIKELRTKYFKKDNLVYKVIFEESDEIKLREWLVKNIKGYGYKEASHFLRNIGKGRSLAILDRHILKNLIAFNVIKTLPSTLTKKKYLTIERQMRKFSKEIGIPMEDLDLLLWYKETGEIFK